MQENIRMPIEIYDAIFRYFVAGERNDDIEKIIVSWIEEKAKSMEQRELYTKFKNENLSYEERNKALMKYLRLIGRPELYMTDKFRI